MIVGKIENGLERGFVKHGLNCLLLTDPECFKGVFTGSRGRRLTLITINWWFVCDVMAAMLVYRNNKIFLLWELTSIFIQTMRTNFLLFCTPTWRPCKPPIGGLLFIAISFSFVTGTSVDNWLCHPTDWTLQVLTVTCIIFLLFLTYFFTVLVGGFLKTSKHFIFGDPFLYSHNLYVWSGSDIVRRN